MHLSHSKLSVYYNFHLPTDYLELIYVPLLQTSHAADKLLHCNLDAMWPIRSMLPIPEFPSHTSEQSMEPNSPISITLSRFAESSCHSIGWTQSVKQP